MTNICEILSSSHSCAAVLIPIGMRSSQLESNSRIDIKIATPAEQLYVQEEGT